jgi:hypothetical protein
VERAGFTTTRGCIVMAMESWMFYLITDHDYLLYSSNTYLVDAQFTIQITLYAAMNCSESWCLHFFWILFGSNRTWPGPTWLIKQVGFGQHWLHLCLTQPDPPHKPGWVWTVFFDTNPTRFHPENRFEWLWVGFGRQHWVKGAKIKG